MVMMAAGTFGEGYCSRARQSYFLARKSWAQRTTGIGLGPFDGP